MSHPYFRFKQFIVYQDQAAMKVCTDSCLFGAWVADDLSLQANTNHILDIGAGTGLLSLFLAQKNNHATIDAVEAESLSAQQARENCQQSPRINRISVYQSRIQDFFPVKQYDVIISNPPFYQDHLLSTDDLKNIAHHNTSLTFQELVNAVKRLLSDKGLFYVLLPYHRTGEFENIAKKAGLFLHKKMLVKQTPKHDYFRSLCLFSKDNMNTGHDEIIIKDEQNQYTPVFIDLLKDYYLFL